MLDLIGFFKSVQAKKSRTNSHILKAGFTLIELSIVLVIIGLLVGGIMTGQSLIRAAEIRSIITQKEQFVTSANTFKFKYNQIPGDTTDAQILWGAAANCTSAQTTTATCNVTGNGLLDNQTPSGIIGNELFLFWKHLANAGLIAGNFTGTTDGSNEGSVTSNNSPTGKLNQGLWMIAYFGTESGNSPYFDGIYNHTFLFGRYISNNQPASAIITSQEAFVLDTKIDDGKPGTGNIRPRISSCSVQSSGSAITAVSADTLTAAYSSISTGNQCALFFPNLF